MQLSRRDALVALGAAGVAVGGTLGLDHLGGDGQPIGERDVETLVAIAEVVYPTQIVGVPGFVETYSVGRAEGRPEYVDGVTDALTELDEAATDWYDSAYRTLDPDTRDSLLRELGADTAEPSPEGTTAERVRYYLVNELLFALYASPTGGELVGLENPQGHPGGTASYQRGPES